MRTKPQPRHRPDSGRAALLFIVAFFAAACSNPSPSSPPASAGPSASPSALASGSPGASALASASPAASPSPGVSPSPAAGANLLGTDGRFTVLLLGSDYRPAHPGNRTDAIMVVSLDPVTGKVAAFSVPRDTVNFPLPGGGRFTQKVNALYQWYQTRNGKGMASMKQAVGAAFGIEIDYGVLTGFAGVKNLVNAVGGVKVTLAKSYYDPEYWVNPTHRGWGLSAGTHQLDGETALIFARSRKGDNDFNRARRQQQLVGAAVVKVTATGASILPRLLAIAKSTTTTDLPVTRATELYQLVSTAKVSSAKLVVFGPRSYATGAGGTSFALTISACKKWIAANFPPARPHGTWPVTPAPSPSTVPSPSP